MDWTTFLTEAANLSLFELGHLSRAIYELSVDPRRIDQVRAQLKPGLEVHYFDHQAKRMIPARVIQLNRSHAVLANQEDGKQWSVHYRDIQTSDMPPPVVPAVTPKNEWRVGDLVSFKDGQNRDLIGRIEKLNTRTVSVIVKTGERWRVAYSFLSLVHEVSTTQEIILPAIANQETPRVGYCAENLDEAFRHMAEDADREAEAPG